MVLVVKNSPANAGDIRDPSLIPGLGRCPKGEHGNPLQYSCLENPMDRGAWWSILHRVAKSQTQLKQLSKHTCCIPETNIMLYVKYILIVKKILKNIIPIIESKTTYSYNHFKSIFINVGIADDKSSFL